MPSSKENIGIFFGVLAFFLFATTDVAQKYGVIGCQESADHSPTNSRKTRHNRYPVPVEQCCRQ